MKKILITIFIFSILNLLAQNNDDLYFNPKKKTSFTTDTVDNSLVINNYNYYYEDVNYTQRLRRFYNPYVNFEYYHPSWNPYWNHVTYWNHPWDYVYNPYRWNRWNPYWNNPWYWNTYSPYHSWNPYYSWNYWNPNPYYYWNPYQNRSYWNSNSVSQNRNNQSPRVNNNPPTQSPRIIRSEVPNDVKTVNTSPRNYERVRSNSVPTRNSYNRVTPSNRNYATPNRVPVSNRNYVTPSNGNEKLNRVPISTPNRNYATPSNRNYVTPNRVPISTPNRNYATPSTVPRTNQKIEIKSHPTNKLLLK